MFSSIMSPSPIPGNRHKSVIRKQHNLDSECRTRRFQSGARRRSAGFSAVSANTSFLPSTPCKSFQAVRRLSMRSVSMPSEPPVKKRKISLAVGGCPEWMCHPGRGSLAFSPSPSKSLSPTENTRKYFKMGVLGSGSFCTVFKVQCAKSDQLYALKKCTTFLRTKEAMVRSMNEVDIVKHLHGDSNQSEGTDHIVQLHDHWLSSQGQLHQLYTYYRHGTLTDLMDYNLRMNDRQILEALRQIAVGLRSVHSMGIIHLDVKPCNIFVADDWKLVIGDFGISFNVVDLDPECADSEDSKSPQKRDFRCSGDPIYIAPELLEFQTSAENIDFKTDIFSLGIILLEMLYDSNMPSQGAVFQSLRRNAIDFDALNEEKNPENTPLRRKSHKSQSINSTNTDIETSVVPQGVESAIQDLVRSMLQKEVANRLSAEELISKIDDILHDEQHKLYFYDCLGLHQMNLPPVDAALDDSSSDAKDDSVDDREDTNSKPLSPYSLSQSEHSSPSCPVTAENQDQSCFIEDAPSTFYHEGHLTLDDVLRCQSLAADSMRHSLLSFGGGWSPSSEDQGLQMNLSTVFDSVQKGSPLSIKGQVTPFFERRLPGTPFFGRDGIRMSPKKLFMSPNALLLPFVSLESPSQQILESKVPAESPLKPLSYLDIEEKEKEEVDEEGGEDEEDIIDEEVAAVIQDVIRESEESNKKRVSSKLGSFLKRLISTQNKV